MTYDNDINDINDISPKDLGTDEKCSAVQQGTLIQEDGTDLKGTKIKVTRFLALKHQ